MVTVECLAEGFVFSKAPSRGPQTWRKALQAINVSLTTDKDTSGAHWSRPGCLKTAIAHTPAPKILI